ncbi:SDR family oxidoreductase [Thermobifida halotolerans]|uniref:SDR family oxidoreductase n=1 Tax=Thermobifida halotolerans TaxID=483545 RepID=A0A399FUL3_9ACTN|nr:SDR family oxidoreductase [Thermobifida halotolerans]UOE18829.1 SDR family oxidoreductase [Thermobifida halotolerans]
MERDDPIPVAHPSTEELARDPLPLRGRVALVTGVSRREGIGFAVARRLAAHGASVFCHHYRPHDEEQPWGPDDVASVLAGVRAALAGPGARVADVSADMADPDAPRQVMAAAVAEFGHVDILVANHARSGGDGRLPEVDAAMLDAHWAVNTRSALLLAGEFAARHDGREGGRVIFMTSGQVRGPMPDQICYAAAKGALAAITPSVAAELARRGITVNTVNPGPVQTGYMTRELVELLLPMLPFGRYGFPDDPARLIAWLVTDEARWITGQVISSEGGFTW